MIALFSGGLDSTAAVILYRTEVSQLLHVKYGQRNHRQEAHAAGLIANQLDLPIKYIDIPTLPRDGDTIIGRNLVLIALAASFAGDDRRVLVGCCHADAELFPDCRYAWLKSVGRVANVKVVAPFIFSKKKALAFATIAAAGLDHYDTHTCYEGDHHTRHSWGFGCGACNACKVRAAG